jgi:hypothetical protein
VVLHMPWFVDKHAICDVFEEDGGEAAHVADLAARRLVRQINLKPATRCTPSTTLRACLARC